MVSIKTLTVVIMLATNALSTRYCECRNRKYNHLFEGIQHACGTRLHYCATNCNVAGWNCQYCQYVPAGDMPESGIQLLKDWCLSQEYTGLKTGTIRGTDIDCYTYYSKKDCQTCGGCPYFNKDSLLSHRMHGKDMLQCAGKDQLHFLDDEQLRLEYEYNAQRPL